MRAHSPLLLLLAALPLGAAEQPAGLPPEAEKVEEAYQQEVAKILARTRQEITKERNQVIAALQRLKEEQTARGDLQAALAIKAKIEALASGRDPATDLPAGDVEGALELPRNSVSKDLAEKLSSALEQISEADWDQLGTVDTGIVLKPGTTLLVVPNANDKWRCGSSPTDNAPMNFQGDVAKDPHGSIRWGCLFVQVGDKVMPPGLITGSGRMYLKCNDGFTADNAGVIRLKLLRVVP
jgi:hypothetical protein